MGGWPPHQEAPGVAAPTLKPLGVHPEQLQGWLWQGGGRPPMDTFFLSRKKKNRLFGEIIFSDGAF
jgi:TRAP-type mannitol/chloroaromatic compound transport system substrate-binding protein